MPTTAATLEPVRAVSDLLSWRAERQGERTALWVDGSERLSFEVWERRSNAAAHALLAAGCGHRSRVGLLFGNDDWTDYAVAYLAALKVGATTVHVSDLLPPPEIERRFEQCAVEWVIHPPRIDPPTGRRVLPTDILRSSRVDPVTVAIEPGDLADIVYTAGTTTGLPKAVRVPHGDHLHGFDPERHRDHRASRYFLGPFPAGTSSSQNILLFALSGAPIVVLLSRLDPRSVCSAVETLGVDDMMITPGMAAGLVRWAAGRGLELPSVRSLATGAAAMAPALIERLRPIFPAARIQQFYLSSETIPAMVAGPYDPERPGVVGRASPETELTIRDGDGVVLGDGEVGEIWMRSPQRQRSYAASGPEYPDTFVDGWVRTGDLGHVDAGGDLHFFDRRADAFRCDDALVSTVAIENVLYGHPGVVEACVVAVVDPGHAASPAAAVVLADGTTTGEVEAFARGRLPANQVPRHLVTADRLPRGLIGKVLKREVRTWFDPRTGETARRDHLRRQYW